MTSEIVYTSPKYIGLVIIAVLVIILTCFLALRQFAVGAGGGAISKNIRNQTYTSVGTFFR